VYLLNRDSLGGLMQGPESGDKVVQRIGPRGGVWSRPGVWPGEGGYVYIPTSSGSSGGGHLDVYKYSSSSGQPSLSLAGSSGDVFGWGSGAPVITSNGTTSGSALVWIVWSTDRSGAGGQLRVYNPVPVNNEPVLVKKWSIGTATNYSMPGVGEGRIYVGNREGKVRAFGSPVAQPLSGSPTEFPTTIVGKSTQKTVTLTANEDLTLTSLESSSSQFATGAPSPALPASLKAGEQISIPVTFTPTKTGLVSASLTATIGGGATTQFVLSGTGQAEGPHLEVTPHFVSLPGVPVGGQVSQTVTFTNVGAAPLTITKYELPVAPFKVVHGLPPHENWRMEPGEEITLTVEFEPTAVGSFTDKVGFETTANEAHAGLSGVAGTPAALHISEEAIQFGPVTLGGAASRSFTITNEGGTPATITRSKPPIGGAFAAETALPEGTTIQAGESVTETVRFTPSEAALATGGWSINANDTSGLHEVEFLGIGVPPLPAALVSQLSPPPQTAVLGQQERASPAVPDAELASALLKAAKRGLVGVRISCPTLETSCIGTILLRTRAGRTATGKRAARGARPVTLAVGSFTVLGGHVTGVRLRLDPTARAWLARFGTLRIEALLMAHDAAGSKHSARALVTLRR
jgi:iron transport multicopper oxidase